MNVMAEAHKRTKAFIAKGGCIMTYAAVLRVTLRHCHSEYKAMQKDQAIALFTADTIAKFEARIAELKAIKDTPLANKWIVTCGNDHPMPVDFDAPNQSWPWASVETCSTWNSPQFARANAAKIRNGKGEMGQATLMSDHIEWDIAKLEQMIHDLKTA